MAYNPNLYGGQNPYQNLAQQQQIQFYQNQLAQLEQQQQAQNQLQQMQSQIQQQPQPVNGIVGKFVSNTEEITVSDVPMNGKYSIFPKQDMTEIYAKAWDGNGNIQTVVYRPIMPQNEQKNDEGANINVVDFIDELQTFKQEVMARFDALEGAGKAETKPVKEEK